MSATLIQVSTSAGGMPKLARAEVKVTRDGLEGDWQSNRKYHGGCDRAVCLFSIELYDWLRHKFSIDLLPGSVGENLTTLGIDLQTLTAGDRLSVGQTIIQITATRVPCRSLNQWDPRLFDVIKGHSGWLARVIQPGIVRPGDTVELLPVEKIQPSSDSLFG